MDTVGDAWRNIPPIGRLRNGCSLSPAGSEIRLEERIKERPRHAIRSRSWAAPPQQVAISTQAVPFRSPEISQPPPATLRAVIVVLR
jgi:hypothetical protein